MDLKEKIERVLSEILSDKYECKVTLRFEERKEDGKNQTKERSKN
jgi:hypothetical protein